MNTTPDHLVVLEAYDTDYREGSGYSRTLSRIEHQSLTAVCEELRAYREMCEKAVEGIDFRHSRRISRLDGKWWVFNGSQGHVGSHDSLLEAYATIRKSGGDDAGRSC